MATPFLLTSPSTGNIALDLLEIFQSDFQESRILKTSSPVVTKFISDTELSILRADNPIEFDEHETITVIGQQGIWLNRSEVDAWRGDLPISEYQVNEDSDPEIINKKVHHQIEYVQELAIRYLRPPTPPASAEIIITQEPNYPTQPAPPLIIRQQPPRPPTPEPLVIRESPPQPPKAVGVKRITISGKRIPPPPRKVIIERLAPLPSKPQNVIIERWLPYRQVKRRVIFNRATESVAEVAVPKNVIVQWEAPEVSVRKEIKYLGVVKANPTDYVRQFGPLLKSSESLPTFVTDIKTPSELGSLASNYQGDSLMELEGELEALRLVDLDEHDLSQYREYLVRKGIYDVKNGNVSLKVSVSDEDETLMEAATQIFNMIDVDGNGTISVEEAERIVLHLNSRLSRSYGEIEVKSFFEVVSGGSLKISRAQFLSAFRRLSNEL